MPPVGRHAVGRRGARTPADREGADAQHAEVLQKDLAVSSVRQS